MVVGTDQARSRYLLTMCGEALVGVEAIVSSKNSRQKKPAITTGFLLRKASDLLGSASPAHCAEAQQAQAEQPESGRLRNVDGRGRPVLAPISRMRAKVGAGQSVGAKVDRHGGECRATWTGTAQPLRGPPTWTGTAHRGVPKALPVDWSSAAFVLARTMP